MSWTPVQQNWKEAVNSSPERFLIPVKFLGILKKQCIMLFFNYLGSYFFGE